MKVLVTGGAGYIGSTIVSALIGRGHFPLILDDFSTGSRAFCEGKKFFVGDVADRSLLDEIWARHPDIGCVIHCAAAVSVDASMTDPVGYYANNVAKSLLLCAHLESKGCRRIIFSSSAAVYASTDGRIVTEESALNPVSPYARTKYVVEMALRDFAAAGAFGVMILRYFNPIGADPELRSGNPGGDGGHLLGKLIEADRSGRPFEIFGQDWPTRDGTPLRDFVHVWDLATAHVAAVELGGEPGTCELMNLGSGRGVTVYEFLRAFESVTGRRLPVSFGERRIGDIAGSYSSATRARNRLRWSTHLTIEDGIRDALRWSAKCSKPG